jgi:hypothetical protein
MAAGVALAVAVLLLAASAPAMLHAHRVREAAVAPHVSDGRGSLLTLITDTNFRGHDINGLTVQPVRPGAPLAPGIARMPGPGEMLVSPTLEAMLYGPHGAELRRRLGARVVGTIASAGLVSPDDARYVRGGDDLDKLGSGVGVVRASGFGVPVLEGGALPLETLLVIVMVIVLLTPVAVFVATAARFGGEDRDRRLAALRLVGADLGATATIAAGEALLAALVGVLAGVGLFLAGRAVTPDISIAGISVFSSDIDPSPALAALVVILVPACSVLATLVGMRRLALDPLGVSRRVRPSRRRLTWRLVLPLAGLALLIPLIGSRGDLGTTASQLETAFAVVLVLIGVIALLPWVVESAVRRAPGGPVPWLLAVRRLGSEEGTTGRVVGAIGLAVAGAIALQMVFAAAEARVDRNAAGEARHPTVMVWVPSNATAATTTLATLRDVPGVVAVSGGGVSGGLLSATVSLRPGDTSAASRVEDAAAAIDTLAAVHYVGGAGAATTLQDLEKIVAAGAFVVLLMIGASMMLAAVEQLRERRRVLAVLAAFGTRRATMTWSVLLQTAVPVAIGLALAIGLGSALGAMLTDVANVPIVYDWTTVALMVGGGATVIAAVTVLTMPLLWRLMAPEALRVE